MKLTNLQKNENIYKQIYFEVHKEVLAICEKFEDNNHLLLSWFNEAQYNPEEFKESFLELFLGGNLTINGQYLMNTCFAYYEKLEKLPKQQQIFYKEYREFMKLFE